jgi:hypothetical protein
VKWLLRALTPSSVQAVTLFGRVHFIRDVDGAESMARLLRHEAVHLAQQQREGLAFYPRYAWFHVTRGYHDNPYEIEARAAE